MNSVPIIDFQEYAHSETRKAFAQKLGNAFSEIGFAVIKNHNFHQKDQDELYKSVVEFFDLPDHVKSKYDGSFCNGQRGYTAKLKEHAAGRNIGDLKEFYHIGKAIDGSKNPHYQANIFPDEVPLFKSNTIKTYETLEQLGKQLLHAIAIYLNIDDHHFENIAKDGISILRPIHYFQIEDTSIIEKGAVRAAEHGDINLITLLMGASAEGLQVKNKKHEWVDIHTQPGEIVVNVGDMLQRHTNDILKSTIHRVINPPNADLKKPRYSIPFFMHANPDASLACIDNCVSEKNPKRYEDITAGEFLMERLRAIGLA
jgi:isopenicillin N synthase-like dioxygenase